MKKIFSKSYLKKTAQGYPPGVDDSDISYPDPEENVRAEEFESYPLEFTIDGDEFNEWYGVNIFASEPVELNWYGKAILDLDTNRLNWRTTKITDNKGADFSSYDIEDFAEKEIEIAIREAFSNI